MELKFSEYVDIDSVKFLDYLGNSLSLDIEEKQSVIDAVPRLSQYQCDSLMQVWEEENEKFSELADKHPDDVIRLLNIRSAEWEELMLHNA